MTMIYDVLIVLLILLFCCLLLSLSITRKQKQKVFSSPDDYGLEYSTVYFPSTDGITLTGWWIPAENSTRTIIFLHGYAGSMDPDLQYAPAFHEHGFNVLTFDFRAHGRSGGNQTSLGAIEVQDAMGACDFARQNNSWSVGLMGFSMGGRTALLTAARCKDLAAVVSDGGPLRLTTAISEKLKESKIPAWAAAILSGMCLTGASLRLATNLFWNEPLVLAERIASTPTLLIHADLDPYTRMDELDKMVAKSRSKIKVWRIAGAKHREGDLTDPEGYRQRVVAFFEQSMKQD